MPLEPKQEYSSKLYAELLSTTGAKILEFAGAKKAGELFAEVSRPVGERDYNKLSRLFLAKRDNAAYAALLTYAVADITNVKVNIVKLDPHNSSLRVEACPYGDAVIRQKNPIVCNLCYGYNAGTVEPLGVKYVRSEMTRSGQHISCFMTYVCMSPSGGVPDMTYSNLVAKVLKALVNKNTLLVSTFSSLLMNLGEAATASLGEKQALVAAKNAYDGGAYLGPVFSAALGLTGEKTDATKLVQEARELTDCKVNKYQTADGFTLYIKNCPQRNKCKAGGFIETACTEFTKGLLVKSGHYEIKTGHDGETCKQDFLQSSPKTEVKANAP